MVQVHVPQGIGGSIPPPGTNPPSPRKPSFLRLLRASLLVCALAAAFVFVIWILFRRIKL
jgi:hypothetical protein